MSVVIGELSTNAALHGYVPGRDFRILLSVYDDVLRIEVVDTPRTRTGVRAPRPFRGGRGAARPRGRRLAGAGCADDEACLLGA
ncbi:ATP-binding protein [Streptomyces anulatus]|uniref:hypothetical protein n=1 Tax=Streptomyces anulatus TaxID=1892 RepID=UPI0036A3086C